MRCARLLVQASLSLWAVPYLFLSDGGERLFLKSRSWDGPAIVPALGLLSSRGPVLQHDGSNCSQDMAEVNLLASKSSQWKTAAPP